MASTVADTIRDLSLRQAVRLAGWENGLVAATIRLLDQADLELEARIARAIEDKAAATTVRRLKDLRDELRAVNLGAYRAAGKHLTSELADFGARLAPATADVMESALPFAFSFTRPSPQLLRSIITSQPFQGALIGEHIDALAGNRLGALMRETEQGLLQGDSLSQILIRIRGRKVGKRFVGGVLDAHRVGRPALEALTRTATAHVQTTAQQRLYEENGDLVRGVVWTATLDHRTCPRICQPRDGRPYEYDPETGAYRPYKHGLAWLFGPGRSHWNDRCTGIAWLRSLDAFERAGVDTSKLTDGERAAMGGPVPVSETYETWLPKQPREIQEIALGKRQAAELRSGKALGEIWRTFQARAVAPVALEEALAYDPVPAMKSAPGDLWSKGLEREVERRCPACTARDRDKTRRDLEAELDQAARATAESGDVYMRITGGRLESVLKDGEFKTQFETASSGGLFDPEIRDGFEREFLGYREGSARPRYGYLSDASGRLTEAAEKELDAGRAYGDVVIRFKRSVKARATLTGGDSYDDVRPGIVVPSRLTAASGRSFPIQEVEDVRRLLQTRSPLGRSTYNEVQVWGGLPVADIEAAIFSGLSAAPGRVPNTVFSRARLIKNLLDLNVQVYVDVGARRYAWQEFLSGLDAEEARALLAAMEAPARKGGFGFGGRT